MTPESTFDRQPSHNAFVGRAREIAELRAGLDDVSAGHGRMFLLSGEPGIGKTCLAEEICNDAAACGIRVVWGRCWEGGGAFIARNKSIFRSDLQIRLTLIGRIIRSDDAPVRVTLPAHIPSCFYWLTFHIL